jgi:uncharacterized protein YqeY
VPTLADRLRADLTAAMKARDELRVATLRMTLAAVRAEEVAGPVSRDLSDADVERVIARETRKRREAAAAFRTGGRPELADREAAEAVLLEGYLPRQLTDEELSALVRRVLAEAGLTGAAALAAAMRAVQREVAGRADGRRVAEEVRRWLTAS